MRNQRTDRHRPGCIVPADYTYVLSYAKAAWPQPAVAINCVHDLAVRDERGEVIHPGQHCGASCCLEVLHNTVRWASTGGRGQCTVCGARFKYGDVWVHGVTGEHIHIGHDCADKYSLLVDRSAYEMELGRAERASAAHIIRMERAEARASILAAHPGLEQDLECGHRIVQDIKRRFHSQEPRLSGKQIALVRKLAAEARTPPAEQNPKIPAPTGRVEFTGTVVHRRCVSSQYGETVKLIIEVRSAGGTWSVWLTEPAAIAGTMNGSVVRMTATLEHGKDPHFAFGKRPTGAVLVSEPHRQQVSA